MDDVHFIKPIMRGDVVVFRPASTMLANSHGGGRSGLGETWGADLSPLTAYVTSWRSTALTVIDPRPWAGQFTEGDHRRNAEAKARMDPAAAEPNAASGSASART